MTAEPEFRWTQDDWGGDHPPAGPTALRLVLDRYGWLVRGVMVLLALVLFEVTADAALATAVSCLELGRTDFATALWLGRADPDRRRGRLIALCYLAATFVRVGLMAVVVAMTISVATQVFAGNGGPAPPRHVLGALTLMGFAFATSGAVSAWVCVAAFASGRKIWLGPEPGVARKLGLWPPPLAVPPRSEPNQAKVLFYLGGIFLFFLGLSVASLVFVILADEAAGWLFLALLTLSPVAFITGIILLESRVLARSPSECWPLDESSSTDPPAGVRDGRGVARGPRP